LASGVAPTLDAASFYVTVLRLARFGVERANAVSWWNGGFGMSRRPTERPERVGCRGVCGMRSTAAIDFAVRKDAGQEPSPFLPNRMRWLLPKPRHSGYAGAFPKPAVCPFDQQRRGWGHSRRSHATCRTPALVRSRRSTFARPASQKDRISAVARTGCAGLVRAVIRGNEGAADTCVGDQAGEPRRFGGIVAGDFLRKVICVAPSSCCSYDLAPIRLRISGEMPPLSTEAECMHAKGSNPYQ